MALAGVLVCIRRAGRIRPLEALADTERAAREMTASRWFLGLLFPAGAIAMVMVARFAGPSGAVPLAVNAALAAAVGLSALSPLIVPLWGRAVGLLLRAGPLGTLLTANVRDARRRGAATAAPLILLVGILAGTSRARTMPGPGMADPQIAERPII